MTTSAQSPQLPFRQTHPLGTASILRELRSRGAEFLTEPVDWGGETRCFFRDPDGHLLEISAVN